VCGRFTLTSTPEELARRFGLKERPRLSARYNVAPGQPVLVVRTAGGERTGAMLHWGLVPPWSPMPDTGARHINARIESVAEKPVFREALKARRCLVPADAFYEWADHGGFRQPYRIALAGGAPFAFAGLWERWRGAAASDALESCAVVTTAAGPLLRPLHERMPVVLPEALWDAWLDVGHADVEALLARLRAAPEPRFAVHPVSLRVNDVRNDDPACAAPAPAAPRQGSLF
jgi:putative SOS response-associated peptidase YedK